ncbi:alpha/beta fold hydrolase [Blastococcus sp. PRF04-17]|uniref:alpha/beta fold hydrolase n=1 Tax=Blastococcus sp. PRF04-17 TaxID=2933797 RepID=UPI001FF23E9C|nr:alpha/beta fold hydrolase [Blastococcus sp. PRF04-17]UOY02369.1 alpha/beta fold hydrolase [Blastococcus sp. PRF04-17]
MERTTSADGTAIAYDVTGEGPLVVVVGGAFNERATWTDLAEALAAEGFTAVSYDRRGRGASGDTEPYAVEREIEDLAAVIAAADPGGPVYAHGVSSGGALLFRALAAGVGVARASVLEVPYRIDGAPPAPDRYIETLTSYVEADDRDGLVEYFQTRVVGLPPHLVEQFKQDPMWPKLAALAPTLVHDGHVLGGNDHSFPAELLASIRVPVLAVTSTGTMSWMGGTSEAVAAAVPDGRAVRLEGGFHQVPPPALAPALAAFYREG